MPRPQLQCSSDRQTAGISGSACSIKCSPFQDKTVFPPCSLKAALSLLNACFVAKNIHQSERNRHISQNNRNRAPRAELPDGTGRPSHPPSELGSTQHGGSLCASPLPSSRTGKWVSGPVLSSRRPQHRPFDRKSSRANQRVVISQITCSHPRYIPKRSPRPTSHTGHPRDF